ncbi:MAG TPA: amidohydrolase family protein, partial [Patescibacteria group bacterium]|nr:amidohydrolase family protein [Patescibacteria group bacterium]
PEYTIEEIKAMTHIAHSWGRRVMTHCYNPEGIRRSVLGGVDIVTHCNLADEESIRLMNQHRTIVVPTMSVYYRMTQRQPDRNPSRIAANVFDDIKRLYDAGLTLAVGTDASGPPAFGENSLELVLYVEKMGLSSLEAIKIGTLNGAKAMGRTDLGTLEKGKLADIIAVEGNPLDDIKTIHEAKNIKMVMKGGDIYKNIQ